MIVESIVIRIWDEYQPGVLIEEFTQKGSPKLVYNGSDDKYQSIMAAEFNFNMVVTDMADGKFYHLYTGNEKRYRVTVHAYSGNLAAKKNPPIFEGYLLPDFYSEPYDNGAFFVDLKATDGLGLLKGRYLEDKYYKQETSVMKLICECLKLTKLNKKIHFTPAIMSAATDYLWHEIAVDGRAYLDGEIEKNEQNQDVMPARKNAYEILELLLKNLGCTLYGWRDVWYIEGINRKHETTQYYYRYNLNASLEGTFTEPKQVQAVKFVKSPQISIISPWKSVEVTVDLDEEGDLLTGGDFVFFNLYNWPANPQAENEIISLTGYSFSDIDPIKNWKKTGAVVPRIGSFYSNRFGLCVSGPGTPYDVPAETESGMPNNYLSFPKPKYVKKSDQYLKRFLSLKFSFDARGRRNNGSNYESAVEDGDLDNVVRISLFLNNDVLKTTNPNLQSTKLLKYELNYSKWGVPKLSGRLEMEDYINDVNNGFIDLRLYLPVSPNPNNPFFNRYYVTGLTLEYTPEKEWKDVFVRDIDFTTKYELDLFHGDTVSDLTNKNFRFRRLASPIIIEDINVSFLSRQAISVWPLGVVEFQFVISYASYQQLQNVSDIRVVYEGVEVSLSELYPNVTTYSWGVASSEGVFYLSFLVFQNSSEYFDDINKWESLVIPVSSISPDFVQENNEWREKWRRYGVGESVRYGVAMGKMYHDVQPEALVNIEGDLVGIYSPREVLKFNWRGEKKFLPLRLTMDFSVGRTTGVVLQEALCQNVVSKGKYE